MRAAILRKNEQHNARIRQLFEELATYSDERLNRQPADGGWSAIQTLHHLILSEDLSLGYVRKKLSFNPAVEKVNFSTRLRSFLLAAYLNSPMKRQAPAMITGENLPAFATLADTRARWEEVRQDWTNYLSNLPDNLLDKQVYKQPFAGRLGWLQTLDFFEAHFQRHRKQASRAAKGGS